MIEELRLANLGVIDAATLDLGPGLTVLTGETGAGKTMVLTGLGLLLGGRPDPAAVRVGAGRAEVEARIRLAAPGLPADAATVVRDRTADAGGDLDDDTLVMARTVAVEGRSRGFLGGRSVPAAVLAEVGEWLVVVHGQADQRRLLLPSTQRRALDRFGGPAVAGPLADYRSAYDRLRAVETELAELTGHARERAREADLLRHGVAEVDAAAPRPDEDVDLAAEAERLGHVEGLREAASLAHALLRADAEAASAVDASGLVAEADRVLDRVGGHDPVLAALQTRLRDAAALLDDVAAELASYLAAVEADPVRLAAVEDRRAVLGMLRRKYGDTLAEVLAWADEARQRLLDLDDDDGRIASLAAERDSLRERLAELAMDLSTARREAAVRLSQAVSAELAMLAMPQARLQVAVERTGEDAAGLLLAGEDVPAAFGPHGVDEVEIRLQPHAGAPARPLARGASGGELSRVMLALEVVLAGQEPVPTMVFDEVDAGVGGRAAVEVGRRLARLARSTQVLVVTHLPQVAAFADHHLVVAKAQDGTVTTSSVSRLDDAGRVRELARMLAGQEDSAAAAAHADELLALAAGERAPVPRRRPRRTAAPRK